jgi:hypothetical protein
MENVLGDRTNLNDNNTGAVYRRALTIRRTNENTQLSDLTLEQLHRQVQGQNDALAVLQRRYEIIAQENDNLRALPMNGALRQFAINKNYIRDLEETTRVQAVVMKQLGDLVEEYDDRLRVRKYENSLMAHHIHTLEARLQIQEKQAQLALTEVQRLLNVVDEQVKIQDANTVARMQ